MDKTRSEEIIINALEWAINVSKQVTHDLIRGMGITSEELSNIGYEKESCSDMHEAANE
ncbi:MAG: hypothetical protein J5525_12285 [Lachnospiraceae bacterium]|nr:hypothetical protein [Lachnospiraceae bacterium]